MPWHSGSTNALGMELAVHYHILDGQRVPVRDQRKSAAILTIDSNNVNVIGPASIAQRLMFAAMAAAAAAPQNESSKYQYNAMYRLGLCHQLVIPTVKGLGLAPFIEGNHGIYASSVKYKQVF